MKFQLLINESDVLNLAQYGKLIKYDILENEKKKDLIVQKKTSKKLLNKLNLLHINWLI